MRYLTILTFTSHESHRIATTLIQFRPVSSATSPARSKKSKASSQRRHFSQAEMSALKLMASASRPSVVSLGSGTGPDLRGDNSS